MKSKKGRYWLFAFNEEPNGGLNDYLFSFNTIEEYEEEILEHKFYDQYQLLDTRTHFHFSHDIGELTKWICKNIGDEGYEEIF
ncbi:hypothetical protein Q7A53_05095 [Halobacillus rhizosphaerae]|uniref:hypothetical protein n=1 Tax=Halobacillus rhizosphaerae TaxID=3064889 RepID=UPI00398AED37